MLALIIACEVLFWVLIAAGLLARYVLKARRLGGFLLLAVPAVDVLLLIATAIDLRRGGQASMIHGLAAVYLGVSVVSGGALVRWADARVAHRFAGGPPPPRPPRTGRAHAAHQRRQWLLHLASYAVAAAVLGGFALLVGSLERTLPMWQVMGPWGLAVVIDFLISFSYTVRPRVGETVSPQET